MLGVLIGFGAGGFIGLCIGVWLVADNVRRSPHGCIVCARPWAQLHDHGPHVHTLDTQSPVFDQDNQGDHA